MITNMQKNIMGTLSFDGKFPGMRKTHDFIVYPVKAGDTHLKIQSDSYIGLIELESGWVSMTKPKSSGAYFGHLSKAAKLVKLDAETLFMLKAQVMATASAKAGTNGIVYCDNSGAAGVFK